MELILASGEGYRLCEPQVRLEKSSWKRGDQEATFDPTFIDPWYSRTAMTAFGFYEH